MADEKYVAGLNDLSRRLLALPMTLATKSLRRSVLSGAYVIRDEARATTEFEDRSGRLRRAIIVKFIQERSSWQQITYYVLAKSGKRFQHQGQRRPKGFVGPLQQVNNDAYYWRFLEFGTSKIKPRMFMRRAFVNKQQLAFERIVATLQVGMKESVQALGGT
jgi:HK97 gp10 family phage protein